MEDALHRLRALGVVLVEVDVPGVVTLDQQAGFPIALFEANLDIPAYLAAEGNGITFDDIQRQIASPDVAGAIAAARGGAIPQAVYEHAVNVVSPELQAPYASYFTDNGGAPMVVPPSGRFGPRGWLWRKTARWRGSEGAFARRDVSRECRRRRAVCPEPRVATARRRGRRARCGGPDRPGVAERLRPPRLRDRRSSSPARRPRRRAAPSRGGHNEVTCSRPR